MAGTDPDGYGLDAELDAYIEREEHHDVHEWLSEQAERSPWWAISFLVHAVAILMMWQWPGAVARERLYDDMIIRFPEQRFDERVERTEPPEWPERRPEKLDFDVEIRDILPTLEPPAKEAPGLDVKLPPVEELVRDVERPVPSLDPPSATPVIAFHEDRKGITRGIYSGRNRSGRAKAIGGPTGTTRAAEDSVVGGLLWLARAQERDGHWDCQTWGGGAPHDVGMTGLALLSFLGAGCTHLKGQYQTTVARGLTWMAANQKPDGSFGHRTFYEAGIAAMAVSEAYGLTRSPKLGRMAQKAIDYIVQVQPDHGGFRYPGAVPKNQGDTSVTGWQIMAIKSAICSELKVPQQAVERSRTFLANSYRGYGKTCYTVGGGPGGPAMWAVGMVCRQFIGGDYDAEVRAAANALLQHVQKAGAGQGRGQLIGDLYYTYYATLGMHQMGLEYWLEWNHRFRDPLVKAQVREEFDARGRFVRGSWDPTEHQWGKRGGRIYSTAMAILTLEVYYRFLPVYRLRKPSKPRSRI
jgi:hypothetical protein